MFRLEDMKKYIILSLLCGCLSVNAQTMVPLTYRQYMERVAEGNFEYASEKLNVPTAKAEVTAAKVFNDPNLSVSYFNNENMVRREASRNPLDKNSDLAHSSTLS